MAGSYEHSTEILGSIKCGDLLDLLRNFDSQEGLPHGISKSLSQSFG